MSRKIVVQKAILAAVRAAHCEVIVYDKTGTPEVLQEGGSDALTGPSSVYADETNQALSIDSAYGAELRLAVSGWQFEASVVYPKEVCLTNLVLALASPVPVVDVPGLGNMFLILSSYAVDHPPKKDSSNGTKATLTFAALDPHVAFSGDE